ncbi:MAG: LysE family translocator [Pyrinomonadaceae bacterium]
MIDHQIIAFAGIAAVLTLTPGADTMLVIRNVVARGKRAGFMTTCGICSGLFVHATLSAVGLSIILVRSATAFQFVKLLGAGYLFFLGAQSLWRAWHQRQSAISEVSKKTETKDKRESWQSFLEGVMTNVLNPKVAIFYLAFLPQFISADDPVFGKSVLLAGIHFAEGIIWLSALTVFLGRMRPWLIRPRVQQCLQAISGAVLIAFAMRLATDRR